MVNGLTATVLEKRNMGVLIPEAEVIIREDSNRVYFFENGQFKLLYDFNLEVGDTMTFSIPHNSHYYDFSCGAGSDTSITAQVLVVSTTMTEVDGQLLKSLYTSAIYHDESTYMNWELGGFTERIGSYNGLFGFSTTQCLGGFSGHLRCYSDNIISHNPTTQPCDFVMGEDEMTEVNTISIYPNPAKSMIRVESATEKIAAYRIRTVNGQTLMDISHIPSTTIEVDLSHLSQGVYIIEAYGMSGVPVRETVIKLNNY